MPSSPDITELWGNFKNLVKKITYDKTEVDDKLSTKANNSLVSQSSNGLMSSTDKVKLDGIADGANKTVVDSTLSSSSTNPVQNKVVNTALNSKASSSHTHTSWGGIQPDAVSASTNESGGYRNIMQIKINGIYTDQPITFDFTARSIARSVRVFILFTPTATTDPGITYFKYDGWLSNDNELYLIKTATSTWNLYCKEVGTYTNVAINNLFTGNQTKPKVTITFPNLRVTKLPTGTSYTASEWLATSSNSGNMSKGDKVKLDGIATGANKTIVDTALSSSSTNPVQNKVVKAQLDSLNNNKANKNHTHNDYTTTTAVSCSYGTVKKFKKNGWAVVVWQGLNLTNISKNAWVTIADVGWTHQGEFDNHYGNFFTPNQTIPRFEVTQEGLLRAFIPSSCTNAGGNYGHIVYPTAD